MKSNHRGMKTFFDPHPGFAGAAIPIPTAVKQVADKLDGKKLTPRKAVTQIKAVTKGKVSIQNGWIALELRASGVEHMFRVIRFR